MANIKSSKKRILINKINYDRNKSIRSRVRTMCKKVNEAILNSDKELAMTALKNASIELSKAKTKGVYHKNTVSRKISRLTNSVNKLK